MDARTQARLAAQDRQMAFEMGMDVSDKNAYAAREAQQERAVYQAKSKRDDLLAGIRPCTAKQVAFIKRLVGEKALTPEAETTLQIARVLVMKGHLTSQGASTVIDELLALPKKADAPAKTETATEPEDGIYLDTADVEGSRIYKVYNMVHGSGRQGVKNLVVDEAGSARFEYMGLALYKLPKTARKMSLEEASAFGRLYGVCVRCGRTLTDETSIANGIGPICAEQM